MNRQEIYAFIRRHDGMAEQIKREFGKNYTLCGNAALEEYVGKYRKPAAVEEPRAVGHARPDTGEESVTRKLVTVLESKRILIKAEADYVLGSSARHDTGEESMTGRLVTVLAGKGILIKAERDYILGKQGQAVT